MRFINHGNTFVLTETPMCPSYRIEQRTFILEQLLDEKDVVEIYYACKHCSRPLSFSASYSTIYSLRSKLKTELSAHGYQLGQPIPDDYKNDVIKKLSGEKKIGRQPDKSKQEAIHSAIMNHMHKLLSAKVLSEMTMASERYVSDYLRTVLQIQGVHPISKKQYQRENSYSKETKLADVNSVQYVFFSVDCFEQNNEYFCADEVIFICSHSRLLPLQFMPIKPEEYTIDYVLDQYIPQYMEEYNTINPLPKSYQSRKFCPIFSTLSISKEHIEEYQKKYPAFYSLPQ